MRISYWSSDVCSSDRFYWVLANVVPIYEHGEVVGYASVRVQPTQEQIDAAQEFYDDINAGRAGGYTVKHCQREIGRARCRERVCHYAYISVSAVSLNKNNKHKTIPHSLHTIHI